MERPHLSALVAGFARIPGLSGILANPPTFLCCREFWRIPLRFFAGGDSGESLRFYSLVEHSLLFDRCSHHQRGRLIGPFHKFDALNRIGLAGVDRQISHLMSPDLEGEVRL